MKPDRLLAILNQKQDMDKSPNPWLFSVKDKDGNIHLLCRDELKKSISEKTLTPEGAELLQTCELHKEFLTAVEIIAIQSDFSDGISKP